MNGKDIITLAADLAAGVTTADFIKDQYGDGVLTTVLAFGAGLGAGAATNAILDIVDTNMGIVSDVGGLIDDVFDIF